MAFKVNWDNNAGACGTFPQEFDTRQEAEEFGEAWANECNMRDFGTTTPWDGFMAEDSGDNAGPFYDDGYSYDVVEAGAHVHDDWCRGMCPEEYESEED